MRRRRLGGGLLACGVTASLLVSPPSAATSNGQTTAATSESSAACASGAAQEAEALSGHSGTASLTNPATRQGEHYSIYAVTEGQGDTNVPMRATTIAGCYDAPIPDGARSRVRYQTEAGSATPTDYEHVQAPTTPSNPGAGVPSPPGQSDWICNDIHELGCTPPQGGPGTSTRPLPVIVPNNSATDEAVRSFTIRLTSAQIEREGNLEFFEIRNTSPQGRSRTVHIVDNDGPSRFSLEPTLNNASEAATYERSESGFAKSDVWIPVFRAGSSTAATELHYELVGSGEHPATEGEDFTDKTNGTAIFEATPTSPPPPNINGTPWARLSWLKIGLVRDGIGESDETFDIILTDPSNPNGVTSTTFTIGDSDGCSDGEPPPCPVFHPKGKLHHPKLNYKYPRNYPYLNEIHLFTQNAKGLDYEHRDYDDWKVTVAELAIRKRFKSGACYWWTGSGWQRRGCLSKRWFRMKVGGGEDYFLYRVKRPLAKSVGKSSVRDYKAWSRWSDVQDNESTLRKGANMNSFEVIPGTKACRNKKTRFNSRLCKPIKPRN